MNKLEIAKKIIKENYHHGDCGIFDVRGWAGDKMDTLYSNEGLQIDICYHYSYFEVFGLTEGEFSQLENFYYSLSG